jgi:putative protein-disulfide isomerase
MKLLYLFDPLCGWCYASSPAVRKLAEQFELSAFATGLFADSGRQMDEAFAAHAWRNDQRIQQLTGQLFTETYRQNLLQAGKPFDSRALTDALFSVQQQRLEQFFPALKALQKARYVDGLDTSDLAVVKNVLTAIGLDDVAENIQSADEWIYQGQFIAQQFHSHGVPALFAETEQGWVEIPSQLIYQDAENVVGNLGKWLEN